MSWSHCRTTSCNDLRPSLEFLLSHLPASSITLSTLRLRSARGRCSCYASGTLSARSSGNYAGTTRCPRLTAPSTCQPDENCLPFRSQNPQNSEADKTGSFVCAPATTTASAPSCRNCPTMICPRTSLQSNVNWFLACCWPGGSTGCYLLDALFWMKVFCCINCGCWWKMLSFCAFLVGWKMRPFCLQVCKGVGSFSFFWSLYYY